MESMKALVAARYGGADVLSLKELPVPRPASDEVLVRVVATTVNRTDTGILSGKPAFARLVFGLRRPKRQIPGTEFAGVVESLGSSRTDFNVGDRVFGFHDEGTSAHAEFLTVSDREAIGLIPDNVDFETAAACSEGPFYALNLLKHLTIGDGARVLINGISGGIGSAMLQLLKRHAVYVVGVCSAEAAPKIEPLGADKIYDYRTSDFRETEQQPFDVILDTVGNLRYRDMRKLLTPNGTFSSTELGPWGENAINAIGAKITGSRRAIFPIPHDVRGSQATVLELLARQQYQPLIDRRYPFEQIVDAYRFVATGQKHGNVLVTLSEA